MARRVGYLMRRGAIYYHRVAVPKALQARLGRREIWRSLQTAELHIAKLRGAVVHLTTLQGFDREKARARMGQETGDKERRAFFEAVAQVAREHFNSLRAGVHGGTRATDRVGFPSARRAVLPSRAGGE